MAPTRNPRPSQDDEQPSSPLSSSEENRSPAISSDKENYSRRRSQAAKRKSDHAMTSHNPPTSESSTGSKRRRLAELQANAEPVQSQLHSHPSQRPVTDFYDPDQDVGERREIRKSLRDLTRDLNGKTVILSAHYVLLSDALVQIIETSTCKRETGVF